GEGQWAGALVKDAPAPASCPAGLASLHPLWQAPAAPVRGAAPAPDWVLSLSYDHAFPEVETDLQTALRFLHRDALVLPDAPTGYLVPTYRGIPLGVVKNLGRRCNNLHPLSRRIRMDV
ncbi:MAG: hypothetical protein J5871_03745, partial [Bacteroidales bacterium]|nr:hypothetical protein [Bacteroidales bacterium]